MVRAVAKSGPRAGQPLWRCSDFDCRSFINIDEADVTPPAPVAGESAQAQFERERTAHREQLKRAWVLLTALAVIAGTVAFFATLGAFADLRVAGTVGVLSVPTALVVLFRFLPHDVVSWRQGAEAERAVGAKLDGLAPIGFVTLYDRRIPGRGGNIDAITVGPPGVYVVETKHRGRGVEVIQGRFEVGGREQPDVIRQVTEQAMLVQVSVAQAMNRHRLTIVPIICVGNRSVSGGERAGGILVLDTKSIAKRLAAEPAVLQPNDVQELAHLLDQALPAYERRNG